MCVLYEPFNTFRKKKGARSILFTFLAATQGRFKSLRGADKAKAKVNVKLIKYLILEFEK